MAVISVLALGSWGTALAQHLALRGHQVVGWTADEKMAEKIKETGHNPHYLSFVSFHPNIEVTTSLDQALQSQYLLLAFPSHALTEFGSKLAALRGKVFISAIKGFCGDDGSTPLQHLSQKAGKDNEYVVLSGPSFARDLAQQTPVGVVCACSNLPVAQDVLRLFAGGLLRVYLSTDSLGVELGGSLKNVIALAAGVSDGLKLGSSARASLITRGLVEMIRLAEKLGACRETLFGLSGLGDLVMTATDVGSRNHRAGELLAVGVPVSQVEEKVGSTVEGLYSTPVVKRLGERCGVELPITEVMNGILVGQLTAQEAILSLINRPIKFEF